MPILLQGVRLSARSLRRVPAAPRQVTKSIGRRRPLSTTSCLQANEDKKQKEAQAINEVNKKRREKSLKELEKEDPDTHYQLLNQERQLKESLEEPLWLQNGPLGELAATKMMQDLMGDSTEEIDRRAEGSSRRRRGRVPRSFLNLGEKLDDGEEPVELEGEEEEMGDDYDNMSVLAHGELAKHQEMRHYARLAAWDLPMLSKLAKPFEPPTADMPLRFRYTSYMGETHPAEKKVALEFIIGDMPDLTTAQKQKLRKLCGTRYNPETDLVKMSCEMYESQAQNKRYLGDRVDQLLKEARDPTDTFEDIPLDLRHHTFKKRPTWPHAWTLTQKRKAELEEYRQATIAEDQRRLVEGVLVDGKQEIEEAFTKRRSLAQNPVPELVAVGTGKKAVRVSR